MGCARDEEDREEEERERVAHHGDTVARGGCTCRHHGASLSIITVSALAGGPDPLTSTCPLTPRYVQSLVNTRPRPCHQAHPWSRAVAMTSAALRRYT